jgi:rfaE bifunctional protein kinase chain/domain/rfaE bifunctional protein nucleotidyltransferase chain/domain
MEYFTRYNYKIKNINQLIKKIGSFPRKKKVCMCHGVFDIIHPGHLRHLSYAKSKCDILIVSLTSDKNIKKGHLRPYVSEKLRLLNMCAFEMVDYVILDYNEKPIKNIKSLKPDFFVKGFEYSKKNINKLNTEEEIKALKSYGGKLIFTPGDIVYSSTKILNINKPDLFYEKIKLYLEESNLDFSKLENIINNKKKISVHILGDTIVDTLTETHLIGGQTKTPTMSFKYLKEKNYIGGAAIVAKHLKAAGAEVEFTTLLGRDGLSNYIIEDLKKYGIKLNIYKDSSRPTTNKNAIICNNYRIIKIDKLDNTPIAQDAIDFFSKKIKTANKDIVIFSDFRHGIFNKETINIFTKLLSPKVIKVADSQVASRWGNITEFKKFDLITPNEKEARFSMADQDSNIGQLCKNLISLTGCKNIILKLGDKGLISSDGKKKYFSIDSFANEIVDPVGAGDALLAYSSLYLKYTGSLLIASIIGSLAAACACESNGNTVVSNEKINKKIQEIKKEFSR